MASVSTAWISAKFRQPRGLGLSIELATKHREIEIQLHLSSIDWIRILLALTIDRLTCSQGMIKIITRHKSAARHRQLLVAIHLIRMEKTGCRYYPGEIRRVTALEYISKARDGGRQEGSFLT